jgi:soluble lytic murein transglycosylase
MIQVLALVVAAAFTAADAAPFFPACTDGPCDGHAAVAAYQAHQYDRAAQAMRRWLEHHPAARERHQAELLLALALSHQGSHAEAAPRFDALGKSYPLLAPYHAYHAGRSYYWLKDYERALDRAGAVPEDSPLYMDATLLRGDALRALGRFADARDLYARYLERFPEGIRIPEATFKLAEAKEKLGEPAGPLFMKVWVAAPLDWGVQAEAHLDKPGEKATAAEWIARGMVLFDAMRNPESEAAFAAALGAPGLDAEAGCVASFHRAQSVFKQRNRTRAAPLFEEAVTACGKTQNEDLKAKAVYQLARCLYSKGDYDKAADAFLRVEAQYPKHSYADDGRLRATEAWAELNEQDPRIDEALRALPEKYPDGDMKQEALWRLALRAWRRGDYNGALASLDGALARIPREDIWYAEGRSYYWKGRTLDAIGRGEEALGAWETCARTYPLSYYALLSLNRLREHAPVRETKLVRELYDPRPREDWSFPARPLFNSDGFRRGVELARLGLGEEARREFAGVGIKAVGKIRVEEGDRRELLWLSALLLDRAGVWQKSHWIARHALEDDWHRQWPRGENHKRWLLAYPHAWSTLLEPAARAAGYPIELVYAVAREESAFDPVDESFANALGLLQMIIPTARRFAKPGEVVTRETLKDPAYNVTVGLRWLSYLFELYDHNPALAVAGHNAGDGAVGRWLKERGTLPLDEWVELIPYDETRNYTKRVMSSYFTYRWLFARAGEDPVPHLGVPLPVVQKAHRPPAERAGHKRRGRAPR